MVKYVLVLALLAFVAGCATGARYGRASRGAQVYVSNQSWTDWTLEIRTSGPWQRLGRVSSLSIDIFRIPTAVSSSAEPVQFRLRSRLETETHYLYPTVPWQASEVIIEIENATQHSDLRWR